MFRILSLFCTHFLRVSRRHAQGSLQCPNENSKRRTKTRPPPRRVSGWSEYLSRNCAKQKPRMHETIVTIPLCSTTYAVAYLPLYVKQIPPRSHQVSWYLSQVGNQKVPAEVATARVGAPALRLPYASECAQTCTTVTVTTCTAQDVPL